MLARIIQRALKRAGSIYVLSILCSILLAGLILVPVQQVQAAGNIYYVAKNGSNGNPGTITQPWLTIQYSANKVVAGDTVYVRSGTYNEQVFISRKSGTALPCKNDTI
jgi:hypothetical protein